MRTAILILAVVLAGCQAAPVSLIPTAQEVLAEYQPRQVWLFTLDVEDTVELPDHYLPMQDHWPFTYSWNATNKVATFEHPSAFWRFQHNDTAILATYRLTSSIHMIFNQPYAISPLRQDVRMHLGGMDFTFEPVDGSLALASVGPNNPATFRLSLHSSGSPAPRTQTWIKEATLPLLDESGQVAFVNAPVHSKAVMQYHGLATVTVDGWSEGGWTEEVLERHIRNYERDFGIGNRFGQVHLHCGVWPLKSYDPCMNPFKWT